MDTGSQKGGLRRGIAALLLAVSAASCSAPEDSDPAVLFSRAEALRRAYDEQASHEAIGLYRDARSTWLRRGERERAAEASQRLGATYEQLGLLNDAVAGYREALSVCRDACGPLLESSLLSDLGIVETQLANDESSQEAALEHCDRALTLARDASGAREEADALSCAGEVEYFRGRLEASRELHLRAKSTWDGSTDPSGRAEALLLLAAVQSDLTQFVDARANLDRALSLSTEAGDDRGRAIALVAVGRLEQRRGEHQEALNHFRRALDRLESSGDAIWLGSALAGMGNVYFSLGDAATARSYWEPAVERYRTTGIYLAVFDLLSVLGRSALDLDEPARALGHFEEARQLAEDVGIDLWRAYSYYFLGQAHRAMGKGEDALAYLERALVLEPSTGDPRIAAGVQVEMGHSYELLGREARAMASFARAVELNRSIGDRASEAEALYGMARVSKATGDLDAARGHIEQALHVTESLRSAVESPELRASYFASIFRFHELYVDVLMGLHDARSRDGLAALAYAASENARARSLLESLVEAGVDIRVGVEPELVAREARLKERVEEILAVSLGGTSPPGALAAEIRELEAAHNLALSEIRSASPRYAALARREPLGLAETQEKLLDDDTLLLEYALGEERSFLWVVEKEAYASFVLPPRAEIEERVEHLYQLLTARARAPEGGESLRERNRRLEASDREYWKLSARLSETLLGPAADRFGQKKIVVVADGALKQLPFAALPHPGRGNDGELVPMVVAHEIVNLPSASALAVLREQTKGRTRPPGTVAVFADPVFSRDDPRLEPRPAPRAARTNSLVTRSADDDGSPTWDRDIPRLEATRHEAASILAAAPEGTTFQAIGFEATRTAAMSAALDRYRIVHFATHGVSNADTPALSGVLLSMFDERGEPRDGFLRLRDIYELDLSADLVVLSACSTALGKQILGEGTVGIVRAFLYAGAERIIATSWKVDDDATQALMSHFYLETFQLNRSPAAALRSAQLATMREAKWQSPFFWAAFVLQGEWRDSAPAPAPSHSLDR